MTQETETSQNPLKTVFVGHVDHGKSTLVGRLLYETDSLEEGKYEKVKKTCEKRGVPFEWAFLMDALQAERNQNITIDTAQIWFETDLRPYTIIDAPGHKEFLKNMVTGAAQANAALLLIAADEGVQEQSRRHCHMLSMLGIDQVTVIVNKMDLVDYDRETFDEIVDEYSQFLEGIGVEPRNFVPTSAREGDNVVGDPNDNLPWWDGNTVIEEMDSFDEPTQVTDRTLRFPIQDIYRFDDRRILAGRVESGQMSVGDELIFTPHGKRAEVETIEKWQAPSPESVEAGESTGITLSKEIFVERGHVASTLEDVPEQTTQFKANIFWLGKSPLKVGEPYKLKLHTIAEECTVTSIERIMDGANLEPIEEERSQINRYDVAEVLIETRRPIAIDKASEQPTVGRFVIVDEYDVAGGGIVQEVVQTEAGEGDKFERVSMQERLRRVGHRGAVLELHAEHADRLAVMLERELFERGINALYLDHVPANADERQLGDFLKESGTVAIFPIVTDSDRAEILIDGDRSLEFGPESVDDPTLILEDLLPILRDEEIEVDMDVATDDEALQAGR
jgi:bifunctional enzyme CysN/CysC